MTELEQLEDFYREMETPALEVLRSAFVYDRAHGADAAFCELRLAIIDAILREREEGSPD